VLTNDIFASRMFISLADHLNKCFFVEMSITKVKSFDYLIIEFPISAKYCIRQ
jgi:hypothetical protein